MSRVKSINVLAEFSERQQGYVSRQQLLTAGISPATISRLTAANGLLVRAGHGVYRVKGAPSCFEEDLYVAWLKVSLDHGDDSVEYPKVLVSHFWAANLYNIGVFPQRKFEFTVGDAPRIRRQEIKMYNKPFGKKDWSWLYGMPVTRPSRIVADLLEEHHPPGDVGRLIYDALYFRREYASAIAQAAEPFAAKYGEPNLDGPGFLEYLLIESDDYSAGEEIWINEAKHGQHMNLEPPYWIGK